jgi:hypothetical protein
MEGRDEGGTKMDDDLQHPGDFWRDLPFPEYARDLVDAYRALFAQTRAALTRVSPETVTPEQMTLIAIMGEFPVRHLPPFHALYQRCQHIEAFANALEDVELMRRVAGTYDAMERWLSRVQESQQSERS